MGNFVVLCFLRYYSNYCNVNLLNPSGFFFLRTTRLNIQKFYIVLALRSVFCTDLRTDSGLCCIRHQLVFITVVESVYSAVRTDALYKAGYVSYLKG